MGAHDADWLERQCVGIYYYYIIGRYVMLVCHSRQTYGARAYALAHTINPNVQLIY
jgi:hypothetical protein